MPTPTTRLGDTVHYTASTDTCRPAIITELGTNPTIRVLDRYSSSDDYALSPAYDTDGAVIEPDGNTTPGPDGFTVGTWHHTH